MSWIIRIEPKARKTLRKFPARDYESIRAVVEDMESNPFMGDIQKMQDEDSWRRRVGNYRLQFRIYKTEKVALIYKIERRTTNTYRK